jgi:Phage integrase family
MRNIRPNLKPGESESYQNGIRAHRNLDGTLVWYAKFSTQVTVHDTPEDAQNWRAAQRTGRTHGQEVDSRRSKQPFAAVCAEWLMSDPNKSKRACETNRDHLKQTGVVLAIEGEGKERVVTVVGKPTGFGAQQIGKIKTADVEDLLTAWRADGYAENTMAGMYSTVRAAFSWAEGRAIGKRMSPCWDVRNKPGWQKVERPLHRPDDADLDEYIGVRSVGNDELITLAQELGPDYELAVWIALCFGLRYEELFGLTVRSVESLMHHAKVDILQTVDRQGKLRPTTKTKAAERYIIDRDLSEDISAHMARRGITLNDRPDTLLFVNARTGEGMSYNAWHKLWRKALVRAGLDWRKSNGQRLGLHDLRSMNRTIMEEVGVSGVTARKRFGHAGSREDQLTDRYARSAPRENRRASEAIHSVVRRVPRASGD